MRVISDCHHDNAYHQSLTNRWLCPCCGAKWVSNDIASLVADLQEQVKELKSELATYSEGWGGK